MCGSTTQLECGVLLTEGQETILQSKRCHFPSPDRHTIVLCSENMQELLEKRELFNSYQRFMNERGIEGLTQGGLKNGEIWVSGGRW